MSTVRLALVSETWFPQVNGVSRTLEKLTEHLLGQGDTVRLFIPRYPQPAAGSGVETVSFPALPLPCYREVLLSLVSAKTMRRELAAFRPDLVHIATEGPLGRAALAAARALGLPVVSSYHTNFSQYLAHYRAGWLEGPVRAYLRRFHNATAVTFCPTPSIRELLERQGFERVEIWSRGVDSARFHPGKRDEAMRRAFGIPPEATVLAYCGRLAREKNLDLLLRAWNLLPEATKERRLLLIGDGPLRTELAGEGDPRIVFAGYRHGEELARLYAAADLFVFPSRTETFGNVIQEAMASGLPAVAFDVPGPRDIIRHDESGLLVPDTGAEAFAAAIAALLADPQRRRELGRRARGFTESRSWAGVNDTVRQHYLRLKREPVAGVTPAGWGCPEQGGPV